MVNGTSGIGAVAEQAVGDLLTQLVDHDLGDPALDIGTFLVIPVLELDSHAGGLVIGALFRRDDPHDLAEQTQRLVHFGDQEAEDEFGTDGQWPVGADERASLGDVLGVVGEEAVETLVLDT